MEENEFFEIYPQLKPFRGMVFDESKARNCKNITILKAIEYIDHRYYVDSSMGECYFNIYVDFEAFEFQLERNRKQFQGIKESGMLFDKIVQPELYIWEEDCGILLKGLKTMPSNIRDIYEDILVAEEPFHHHIIEDKRGIRLSYIKNTTLEEFYKETDKRGKELIAHYTYMQCKRVGHDNIFNILLKNNRFDLDLDTCVRISRNNFSLFLREELGLSNADITKYFLVNEYDPCYVENDDCDFFAINNVYNSRMNYLIGWKEYCIEEDTYEIIVQEKICKQLIKLFKDKVERYLNRHTFDLYFALMTHNSVVTACKLLATEYRDFTVSINDKGNICLERVKRR